MSLEEDLKRVIPADKETRDMMKRLKKAPPPSPEKIEAQLRASGAFRGTAKGKNGPNEGQDRHGV